MMFLLVLILVAAYPVAASSAVRHGQGRLWSTAVLGLLLIAGAVALVGLYYTVPSMWGLLLYVLALAGPVVAVPTALLSFAAATRTRIEHALATAIVGACLGLVCGLIIVVYGLRVW